jgi:hypothetical protein
MPMERLYTYQCRNCKTVATSPTAHDFGRPLCCNQCHSYMKLLWSEPVTTDAQRALWHRGPVWNPGTAKETDVHAKR